MSYQSDITAAILAGATLAPLIGDRFYWDVADGSAVAPYIVAQTISTSSETSHDGDRSLTFPLVQFSCWATTKLSAVNVMAAFAADLEGDELAGGSSVSLVFVGENSTHDEPTNLFGQIAEYRVSAYT
jgi:hypothetical protein